MDKLLIGVDIGGTTIKIGLITFDGEIVYNWEIPTIKSNLGEDIVEDIWKTISNMTSEHGISDNVIGIGVGAPGFINQKTGVVEEAVNIGWKNFALQEKMHQVSNLPVVIENDANLAALAENWKGGGDLSRDVLFITLGTGVGGGIIANGEILNGTNGTAAEIGHLLVDPDGSPCNCGRVGCLETIASATGMVRQAMEAIAEHPDSELAIYYQRQGSIETQDIFKLAENGDPLCENIINKTTDLLGLMMANMGVMINPSQIIIGGGVSKAGEPLLSKVKKSFDKYALPRVSECCDVRLAQLGNDAGIIGAAYLMKEELHI